MIAQQPSLYFENKYSDSAINLDYYYQLRLLEQIPKNESFANYGITDFNDYEDVTLSPTFISLDSEFRDIDIYDMESKISSYQFI